AEAQGHGDAMAKELFAMNPADITLENCEATAVRLGCDAEKYRAAFASAELHSRIQRDIADANTAKLDGFPTIFIGSQKFEGAGHTAETLLAAIERASR